MYEFPSDGREIGARGKLQAIRWREGAVRQRSRRQTFGYVRSRVNGVSAAATEGNSLMIPAKWKRTLRSPSIANK
jgi:hypothetical protein